MPDIQETEHQSQPANNTNKQPLRAAVALYKAMPIGLRRIAKGTALAASVLVLVTFLHPNLQKAVFLTGGLLNLFIVAVVAVQAYIYVGQWNAMDASAKHARKALQISERAYIGIHSFVMSDIFPDNRHAILTIENIGRLPGRGIVVTVVMILLIHDKPPVTGKWWNDFGRTNLFKGNLKLEIPIPIEKAFSADHLALVFAGNARLIAQIRISYRDGFRDTQHRVSDYAFRLDGGRWLSWPVWDDDDMEERCRREQQRYPKAN
jgi:hypothetical protein